MYNTAAWLYLTSYVHFILPERTITNTVSMWRLYTAHWNHLSPFTGTFNILDSFKDALFLNIVHILDRCNVHYMHFVILYLHYPSTTNNPCLFKECCEYCLELEPEPGVRYVVKMNLCCVFQLTGVPLYQPWIMPQQTSPLLSRVLWWHTFVIKATAVSTRILSSPVQLAWNGQQLVGFAKVPWIIMTPTY